MANKYKKRYFTMSSRKYKLKQWNTTTPIRMAKIQNTDNTKCWQGCGLTGTLIHCWWECKMGAFALELNVAVSYRTKHALTMLFISKDLW